MACNRVLWRRNWYKENKLGSGPLLNLDNILWSHVFRIRFWSESGKWKYSDCPRKRFILIIEEEPATDLQLSFQ